MRCHICNGFTNERCIICNEYTCYSCMDDGICKRCFKHNSYIGFPSLTSVANPTLFIIGMILIFAGFLLAVFSSISFETNNGNFIYIFPFIFIQSPDPIMVLLMFMIFAILPIMLILWMIGVRFK